MDYCYSANAGTNNTSISLLAGKILALGASTRVSSFSYFPVANHLALQQFVVDPATSVPVAPATPGTPCGTGSKAGALALSTSFTYDSVGNVASIDGPTPGSGDTVFYSFDIMRRITRKTQPAVLVPSISQTVPVTPITRYSYDLDGQLLATGHSIVAAPTDVPTDGHATLSASEYQIESRAYWPTGDLQSVQDADQDRTQYAYDAVGNQVLVTDGEGRRTSTVYDAAGQISCKWKGWDSATPAADCFWDPSTYAGKGKFRYSAYNYSDNGKRRSATDANGNVTLFSYDSFDRSQYSAYPDPDTGANCALPATEAAPVVCAGKQTYEKESYDEAGNQTAHLTRNGDLITFTYDAANRRTTKAVPRLPVVSLGYNLAGDAMSASVPASGSLPAHSTTYGYDAAGRQSFENNDGLVVSQHHDYVGNVDALTWPDTYTVSYLYNNLNELKYAWEGAPNTNEIAFYDYDVLQRRTLACYGGQSTNCIGGSGTNKDTYSYEADGDLSTIAQTLPGGTTSFAYVHNGVHQLISQASTNGFFLPASALSSNVVTAPNRANQYDRIAGVKAYYDLNGNLTSWTDPGSGSAHTYTYDAENRLRTVVVTGPGATNATYDYDALGRRVGKTVAGVPTTYLLNGSAEIGEYTGSALMRRYIDAAAIDDRIARVEGNALTNPTKLFYHVNHQGSVLNVVDASGNSVQRLAYDDYGNSFDDPNQTPPPTGEPFRFTGRRYDAETGLYYYRGRYYSPQIGRFLQSDSVGFDADLNLYAYVNNDPLSTTDPSGQTGISDLLDGAEDILNSNPEVLGPLWAEGLEGLRGLATVSRGVTTAVKVGGVAQKTAQGATNGVKLELKYMDTWTEAQRVAADAKVAKLDEAAKRGELVTTTPNRSGTNARKLFQEDGGVIEEDEDVDHIIDLQLGGENTADNLWGLNKSVNRSLGPQIYHQTKRLPPNTPICSVTIGVCK